MVPDLRVRRRSTLGAQFDPRSNSLNAIRLGLAVLVLVAHAWELGGYGLQTHSLGPWAVAGFFCLSGYLITASREHSRSFGEFLWRRALRIWPAFIVVLVVVAFGFAPFAASRLGAGPWTFSSAMTYVLHNAGLWIVQPSIPGMLGSAPYPDVWNGSLWTLAYEFACYLVIGALFTVVKRGRRWVVGAAWVGASVLSIGARSLDVGIPDKVLTLTDLLGYFLAGAVLYLWRDRVTVASSMLISACTLVVLLAALDAFPGLAGLPVAYALIVLSIRLPLRRIGARNDVSYGVYIYAFPLQQMLAIALVPAGAPVALFVAFSVILTVPFAWGSWLLIERPALRFKDLFTRTARGSLTTLAT